MLTTDLFISILSLCITCFALGYAMGSESNKRHKNNRQVLRKRWRLLL